MTAIFNINTYLSMAKAGLPLPVVRQRMSVDIQCDVNESALEELIHYISVLKEGQNCTLPEDAIKRVIELEKSKYLRMIQAGATKNQVETTKYYDEFKVEKAKSQAEGKEEPEFFYVPEFQNKGAILDDKTVGDEDVQELKNESYKRAQEIKADALKMYNELLEKERRTSQQVESTESEQDDTAPLTSESDGTQYSSADYSPEKSFPSPVVISTIKVEGKENCIGYTHLNSLLYSVDNFFTSSECENLMKDLEFSSQDEGFHNKLISKIKDTKIVVRTNMRRRVVDINLARNLWSVIKQIVPKTLPDGRKLKGIRSAMYFYRYSQGQYFTTHLDGGYFERDTGNTSEYTFVLYLNDNFEGGFTRFCGVKEWEGSPKDVKPKQGGLLIFSQREMKHCGVTVLKGRKYIIQGMVMYSSTGVNKLGRPIGKAANIFQTVTCDC